MTDLDPSRWQRLEELFAEAVTLPEDCLDDWLAAKAVEDPELALRLRELLEHDRIGRDRIAGTVLAASKAAALPAQWTGKRFGVYRIAREIGRGGMGLVFEAFRDDDEVRQRVALKIAPWCRDLNLLNERFRTERQILAGLEHPNIARFLDAGTEDGVPYFAMEFVDGLPITEFAQGKKLRERIALFGEVCAAVQFAHEHLVVHRDLKPANILVTEAGVPKLLDFGIAKVLSEPTAVDGTVTGAAPWTPDYASPEQVRSSRITTRTDVYSLGLVLFEILTGERAQVADTSSPLAMDRSICEAGILPPSSKVPRAMARQLAGDLDTITAKAAHKDPERRYASAADLGADLGRYLDGRPVQARKDSALYRASRFIRRHRIPIIAAAVTVIGLVGGAAAFAWEARLAQRRFDQVRKLATVFLFDVHDQVQDLPGATGVRDMITKVAVESLDNLSRDAGRNYALRRELAAGYLRLGMVQGGMTGATLSRHSEALESFERGLRLLDGMPVSELRQAVETEAGLRSNRGYILGAMARGSDAEADLKRAFNLLGGLCKDPVRDKQPCLDRVTVLSGLIQVAVKHRQPDAVEAYHKQFDEMTEWLKPILSPLDYRAALVKSKMQEARLAYLRGGDSALEDVMRPSAQSTIDLVEDDPRVNTLRMGVGYFGFYGGSALHSNDGRPDPGLEAGLKQSVGWTKRLMELDPRDNRSFSQGAEMKGLLGAAVSRHDPAAGAILLRQSVEDYIKLIRATPRNMDELALMVDMTDLFVRAMVKLGREEEAAQQLHAELLLYDPLMMLGMALPRSEAARTVQALAWIAEQSQYVSGPQSKWSTKAVEIANAALKVHPNDAPLQAAGAQLFDALPDARLKPRARELWRRLALQFPENGTISKRAAAR